MEGPPSTPVIVHCRIRFVCPCVNFFVSGLGCEVPYRIYVDSGYTFACITALAPLCPLLGLVCLLYMIIVVPMLRWLLVFVYRPAFDGGGDKWPKLHHMIVTSLLLGQVSLAREYGFAEKENPSLGLARDRFCFIGSTKKAQFAFASFF